MNFDPIRGVIQIPPDDAKRAAYYLLYSIRKIKQSASLPLTPYKTDKAITDAEHAMHGILSAAETLGLKMADSTWGNEIDSTNHT